jgi:hypothetical protein
MKIRCIDGKNAKLVEGQIYDAKIIVGDKDKSPKTYDYRRVELYNGDRYNSIYRFETLDGKPLDTIYVDESPDEDLTKLRICLKNISQEDLLNTWIKYEGGGSSKYFVNGNYYKVAEINQDWSYSKNTPLRIKLVGFENFWTSSGSFRLLKTKELRELKIDVIDGVETVTTNYTRKFDAMDEEDRLKVLMGALIRARKEFAKNNFRDLTMEEYIVSADSKYGITIEDLEEFKKLNIAELFEN